MSQSEPVILKSLYRYPVKGLTAQPMQDALLEPGQTLPLDRAYAIENGTRLFDQANPVHMPKTKFLMLMRHERLAQLETTFEDEGHTLAIFRNQRQVARGRLIEPVGRNIIEQFFAAFMPDALLGPPVIVHAPGHSISDVKDKCLSIINLASLGELARITGREIHPLRFRANIYLEGLAPFAEFDWLDREIKIGGARLQVFKRTQRCAAVNVDPETGARDLALPQALLGAYGHSDMGVYARVIEAGPISRGDPVSEA
ncbi:MAG: MOSC domain-containing protein [Hyphomicrobiales bacterium]|nr:MAG: MOSC domain-containing protein [Hyphomicrobiales bacterium]